MNKCFLIQCNLILKNLYSAKTIKYSKALYIRLQLKAKTRSNRSLGESVRYVC